MDKYDFLMALSKRLDSLPEADRQRSVDYYAEIIDDRMEEGLSEEAAVATVGNLDDIVTAILADVPVSPAPIHPHKGLRWWEITLLILGSPIWLSLLIAVAAIVLCIWFSLWSVVLALYATAIALGAAALGCIVGSFFMISRSVAEFIIAWGGAFVCAGLTILLFMLSNLAAKGMIALTKLTGKGIRRIFCRKE